MQRERLSLTDKTQCGGYSNHIQRYTLVSEYCRGKRVLDAGCGTGYGSTYLMGAGAASVTGVNIADEGRSLRRINSTGAITCVSSRGILNDCRKSRN